MSLLVLERICSPKKCEHECVDVCPQNKKGKTAIKIEKEIAEIIHKNCISCLQCVYVCPFEAIEVEIDDKKRITPKILKTPEKKKTKEKDKEAFEVNADVYESFNEKFTIFSRRMWDEEFEGYKKPIFEKAKERAAQGLDGYSELESAAVDAAWSIENMVSMREFMTDRIKTLNKEDAKKMREQQQKRDVKQVNYDIQKPQKYKVEDPKEMTTFLKKVATFYGANLIGIAPFDPKWIYSHDRMDREYVISKNIKYAVVIAVEMDFNAINTSPKMPGGIATGLGYSKIAFVRTLVANFIKNLGYEAIPAGNSLGLSVPLAIEAGLGGFGRHGLLITKKYGPRVRVAKILTDMPLVADKPDYKFAKSVEKFCETCMTCADRCPSASITFDDKISYKTYSVSNNPGVKKWYVDVETCYLFWLENGGDCSNCISDCEYNHIYTWPHKIANWIVMNLPFLNPIWPYVGKLLGYGGNKSAKKMWKKIKSSP
ncbi:MAG: reductive dehalogenase [Candidatus Heimdallarchaeota archaeon]|nr:reductive dehalogenase [Candidatus Heimdallarchaeota archaeon]MCK4878815.1 reductive dehalogenase [Candidatus Heimdallarchaeota archaeon]